MANSKIKCLKCGSYIHDTDHCWNWKERRLCYTHNKYKESCDCAYCEKKEICQYCNYWLICCYCDSERCTICNENLKNHGTQTICFWDHTKSLCQFCKLPTQKDRNTCPNNHHGYFLCKVCNMPEPYNGYHQHDDSTCKICGTLLTRGRCIYKCVNGGDRCIYCHQEDIVNNICLICNKEQSGSLTKAAIK